MPQTSRKSVSPFYKDITWKSFIQQMKRFSIYFPATLLLLAGNARAGTETFTSGAFIINMGVTPQTVSNGLKPYGLIYDLLKNYNVPVKWVVGQGKIKDGVDFTYNGQSYRGGTYIIQSELRSAAVNARITAWQALGVVGVTTTTSMTLAVTMTLGSAPIWCMDAQNGSIAIKFLQAALIPATAYSYRTPATLTSCDDVYVMPHADPTWATHSNLYFWNKNYGGAVWGGCHAVSAMEGPNCVNPLNPAQNLKFWSTGGLVLWSNHSNGSPPYTNQNFSDPVFQFMGTEDAAHLNGSEQIYMPLKVGSTWNPGLKIGCYDPTQSDIPALSNGPAIITAYGRANNDSTRGYVMYQAGHNIGGTGTANVAAQRQFFNWSFKVATEHIPQVTYSNIPSIMNGGQLYNAFTANVYSPVGLTVFTYQWNSSVGGTFSAPTSGVTNFTPPVVAVATPVTFYCKVTDGCGRSNVVTINATIVPVATPPVAINDSIKYTNLCSATPQTINVLTNDYDINGNMVNTITFIGGGNNGTFRNNGNGSVTYTPGWIFQGTDTMRYQVCDATSLCSQATIVVTTGGAGVCAITQYLRAGIARADSVMTNIGISNPTNALSTPDASDGSNLLTAKFSADADSIVLRLDAWINIGDTVRLRAAADNNTCIDWKVYGALTYAGLNSSVNSVNLQVPAATQKIFNYYNFIVTQKTQYVCITIRTTACDNKLDLDALYANYRSCESAVPIVNGETAITPANISVTTNIKSNDSDPQGQALSYTIVRAPGHGIANINGSGNLLYTPSQGFGGFDTLIYKACNAMCVCDTAMLIIDVQVHQPCGTSSGSDFRSGNATAAPSNVNVTNPTFAIGAPDETDGSNASSAKIQNITNSYLVLDLTDSIYAADTVVIRMSSDNNSAVTIKVQGNLTNAWGAPTTTTNFNLPAGANKIYADYNFILAGTTRYIRIMQISTIANVDVDAASYSFWHCFARPNHPPVAVDDSYITGANHQFTYNVTANDSDNDGDALTATIIGSALHGTNSISSGNITYNPTFGYTGQDTITYKICDSGSPSMCDTAIFVITVNPGPPVAMKDTSSVTSGSFVTINVQANDTLAVTGYTYTTSLMSGLLPPTNGTAVLVGNNVKYTPNAGFTGTDSLIYQLCDNATPPACDTAFIYVTVNNQNPVANADAVTTSACNAIVIDVLGNDTDPENGMLTITSVSVPTNGTAGISNNKIVYTPSSSPVFTGVATFTYQVCDNGTTQKCATGNVSVTVNAVSPPSNPPILTNDYDSTYINQDLFVAVLANDVDPDGDSIRVDSMATGLLAPTLGTIYYQPNNQIHYVPNVNVQGLDSFQYKVWDIHTSGSGCVNIVSTSSIAKAYIRINNRPPAANDDFAATITTVPITNSVATNDIEPDGQPMTFSIITGPTFGSIALNANGTYTYTPDGSFVGTELIKYLVCDNGSPALCDTAVLTMSVGITNVPPNALPDSIFPVGITPIGGNVGTNDSDPNGNLDPNGFARVSGPNTGVLVFNANGTFTYTAEIGFIGTEYVLYQVCDTYSPALCAQATLSIHVVNLPPVTYNENDSLYEDSVLTATAANGILSNGDYDPNGMPLLVNVTPLVNPAHGIVSVNANGSFTYTPTANYNGPDFFVVNVCENSPGPSVLCTADTVFLTIRPVNDPPVLDNEIITTNEDTPYSGDLTDAGDSDPDGTALTANTSAVSGPLHGSIIINANGTYTYTPATNYNGPDQVVVSICDAGTPLPAICVNDTIFITVNPVNDPPVLDNEIISTNEDTPVSGDLTDGGDSDPDGTSLTANTTPVSGPTKGIIIINTDGTYTYTPTANYNGPDMVVVSICDAGSPLPAICVNDTIFITVNPVNDAPVLDNEIISTNEDTPYSGDLTDAGDSDPDGTALTANTTPVSGPSNGSIIINANGTYTYTPALNYNGPDQVVVSICDAGTPLPAICVNDTIFITVNPVNDAPVIDNEIITTNEDTPYSGDLTDAGDSDPDGTSLTANTTPVSGPTKGTIIINADGTYTYTPTANYNGPDMVVVSICDAGTPLPAICVNDTIFITVNPVNDAPVLDNEIISTNEDTPYSGDLTDAGDSDPDGTALTANTTPVSGPSNGSIIINANGTYTYTPALNYNGPDQVVVSICDAGTPLPAICVNDTIFITVNPVNDAPVLDNEIISTNEDTPYSGDLTDAGDSDPDGTALTANTTAVSGPLHGSIIINANGTYTYTPALNYNGADTVVTSICDAGTPLPAICVNDTIFITVNPVNDAPVIDNEIISTNEDTPYSGDLTDAGDSDPDGTALTANTTPVSGPSNGSIIINANGTYTYTPALNFNGPDMVVVSICDAGTPLPAICVNDTIFITVNPVNDAPVIDNEIISTNEDTPYSGDLTDAGDSDPDGTALTANTTAVSGPLHGSIVISANGTYTYTPALNYNGPDMVVVNICDAGIPMPAICVRDTIFITVIPVNDQPVAVDDYSTTNPTVPVTLNLLTNDFDVEGDSLTMTYFSPSSHGVVTDNGNGSLTYTSDSTFILGVDSVIYAVCDNGTPSLCDTAIWFIIVPASNIQPNAVDDAITTPEDSAIQINVLVNDYDWNLDSLTITTITNPSHGTAVLDTITGFIVYTPDTNYNGIDQFTYFICDDDTVPLCDSAIVTVNVLPVNDAPVLSNDTISVNEDNTASGNILTTGDFDPDSTALTVDTVPISGPTHGSISIDGAGNYTYTPNTNYNGLDTIVIRVCDAGTPLPPICVNDTLVINVIPVNDTLVVFNDTTSIYEDSLATGTILTAGEYDPDSTTLTVNTTPVAGPAHGVIVMNGNGNYSYMPDTNFNGNDTVIFAVCDGGIPLPAICLNDTLVIRVLPVNDTLIIANDTIGTNEDTPVSGTIINANDYDPDNTVLTVDTLPVSGPNHGSISMDSTGNFTYTPSANYNGSDTVVFTVCDGGIPLPVTCGVDTLFVTIGATNDNPVAVNDTSAVCSGSSILVDVLLNDTDPESDSLFVSSLIQPANGTAATNGITITYTPNAGYHGLDSLDYSVCDNGIPSLCSSAKVYIMVNGIISSGIAAQNALCFGDSSGSVTTNAFPAGTHNYNWNNGDTTANISNVPIGNYVVTITDAFGCSFMDSATVNAPPGIVLASTASNALCFGDSSGSVMLGISGGTTPYTYLWSNGVTTQNLLNATANSYTVLVTDSNGCSKVLSDTIRQPFSPVLINGNVTRANCLNNILGSINVTVSGGTPGYMYAWSTSQVIPNITAPAGTYTLNVTDNNACLASSAFTIQDNSALTIATFDSTVICAGDTVLLQSAYSNGIFQWLANGVPIPGATDSVYNATQSGSYTLAMNGTCGAFNSNNIDIVVNPLPTIAVTAGLDICENASSQLNASGAATYSWMPSTGLSNPSIGNPMVSPPATTTYTVTGTTNGCSGTNQVTVTVHSSPQISVSATPFDCDLGSQLHATGGTDYVWIPADGLNSINIDNPVATPKVTTLYMVTVRNIFQCATTDTVRIIVNCDSIFIPNGISPDENGENDAFVIVGLNFYPENKLQIYNRWGNLVFQAKPYHNDWKGTCSEFGVLYGKELPDGTYYYILDLGEGKPSKQGFLEIRR